MYQAKRQVGFTLLEMMMTVGLMGVVIGSLVALSVALGDTVRNYNETINATSEARRALYMLVPRLSHASRNSINWSQLPGSVLTFRMPTDLDGNGTCASIEGTLELGEVITVQRDLEDLNNDGLTGTQLVMVQGDNVVVVANNIYFPPEPGTSDTNFTDLNQNGRWDRGFAVIPSGNGLRIVIDTVGHSRQRQEFVLHFEETVVPRNP